MRFRKGDEVHFIFNGLMPSLLKGTVGAVYVGTDKYRIDGYGQIPARLVFPRTVAGLKAANAAYRAHLLDVRDYDQKRLDEIDKRLQELETEAQA